MPAEQPPEPESPIDQFYALVCEVKEYIDRIDRHYDNLMFVINLIDTQIEPAYDLVLTIGQRKLPIPSSMLALGGLQSYLAVSRAHEEQELAKRIESLAVVSTQLNNFVNPPDQVNAPGPPINQETISAAREQRIQPVPAQFGSIGATAPGDFGSPRAG